MTTKNEKTANDTNYTEEEKATRKSAKKQRKPTQSETTWPKETPREPDPVDPITGE